MSSVVYVKCSLAYIRKQVGRICRRTKAPNTVSQSKISSNRNRERTRVHRLAGSPTASLLLSQVIYPVYFRRSPNKAQYSFLWFIAHCFSHSQNVRASQTHRPTVSRVIKGFAECGVCRCSCTGHAFDVHSNENSFHRKCQMTSSSSLLCWAIVVLLLLFLFAFLIKFRIWYSFREQNYITSVCVRLSPLIFFFRLLSSPPNALRN